MNKRTIAIGIIIFSLFSVSTYAQPLVVIQPIDPKPEGCVSVGGICATGIGCGWKVAQGSYGECIFMVEGIRKIDYICTYDYCEVALAGSDSFEGCENIFEDVGSWQDIASKDIFQLQKGTTVTVEDAEVRLNVWHKLVEVEYTCDEPQICLMIITPACNPITGEIKDFPTSCIDEEWTTDLTQCETCTIDADCVREGCFPIGVCIDNSCEYLKIPPLLSIPPTDITQLPCEGAVWSDFPECGWNTAACKVCDWKTDFSTCISGKFDSFISTLTNFFCEVLPITDWMC